MQCYEYKMHINKSIEFANYRKVSCNAKLVKTEKTSKCIINENFVNIVTNKSISNATIVELVLKTMFWVRTNIKNANMISKLPVINKFKIL